MIGNLRELPAGIPAEWAMPCSECGGTGRIVAYVRAFNGDGSLGCLKCNMQGFVLTDQGRSAISFLASFLKEEMVISVSGGWAE